MAALIKIGLIGDYDPSITAHQAIAKAFALANDQLNYTIDYKWVPTNEINHTARISQYDGLWCVPGSPYKSMDGALRAIQYARENNIPFLGTCGGFQHAIIEYARNVIGWKNAEHAEISPNAELPVITELECSLVEITNTLHFVNNTKTALAYGNTDAEERYRCRYGINPKFEETFIADEHFLVSARDSVGEIRAIELNNHPFFIATLFQPERTALLGKVPPLIAAFIQAINKK